MDYLVTPPGHSESMLLKVTEKCVTDTGPTLSLPPVHVMQQVFQEALGVAQAPNGHAQPTGEEVHMQDMWQEVLHTDACSQTYGR